MPYTDKDKDKAYKEAYRQQNREKAKVYAKEYYKKNPPHPEKVRARKLKHRFGITLDQYNEMFEKQEGCCDICKKHQSEFKKRLAVDHCHTTGEVRALLCASCNQALGMLNEDSKVLKNMILYIKKFKKVSK